MEKHPTSLEIIKREIAERIEDETRRIGVHCRVFSRIKDYESIREKVERKRIKNGGVPAYTPEGKKMQDIIGIRIVTYFYEDVQLLWDLFENTFEVDNEECEDIKPDNFKAIRKNMVCKMPLRESIIMSEFKDSLQKDDLYKLVDNTFEIQFRTTLSEGWHEVDHMLRYKLEKDWMGCDEENRMLNGIYATLETSDRALKSLFDDLAYRSYRTRNWTAMLRFKFRLHTLTGSSVSSEYEQYLNENLDTAKRIFRSSRTRLVTAICRSGIKVPLTLDNIIGIINYLYVGDEKLAEIMSPFIVKDLEAKMKGYQDIVDF